MEVGAEVRGVRCGTGLAQAGPLLCLMPAFNVLYKIFTLGLR
jgi:hypothetical protein